MTSKYAAAILPEEIGWWKSGRYNLGMGDAAGMTVAYQAESVVSAARRWGARLLLMGAVGPLLLSIVGFANGDVVVQFHRSRTGLGKIRFEVQGFSLRELYVSPWGMMVELSIVLAFAGIMLWARRGVVRRIRSGEILGVALCFAVGMWVGSEGIAGVLSGWSRAEMVWSGAVSETTIGSLISLMVAVLGVLLLVAALVLVRVAREGKEGAQ